jgi:hypothetical protein
VLGVKVGIMIVSQYTLRQASIGLSRKTKLGENTHQCHIGRVIIGQKSINFGVILK